jgi:hypothetical protein
MFFATLQLLHLEESKSLKDNLEGKLPIFLEQAGFNVKDAEKPYRGIRFWLAKKK